MKAVIFGTAGKRPGKGKAAAARGTAGTAVRGVERYAMEDFGRILSELPADTLVYVDVSRLNEGKRAKTLSAVLKKAPGRVGVVDPTGSVKDVASLFHAGVVDYIGKAAGGGALSPKRLAAVRTFASRDGVDGGPKGAVDGGAEPSAPVVADRWGPVADGKEHRFAFLFIEVDDAEELKKRYEPANLAAAMESFRAFVERTAAPHGGRTWMWSRFGGLVLFPLQEPDFPVVLCGLRLILSGIFYNAEESPLPGRLSFRLALSVGTTVYKAKDTGRIVSDGVNSIFHLGRRFAQARQFVITAEAAALAPEALRGILAPAGTYEGRRVLRLLRPVPALGGRG